MVTWKMINLGQVSRNQFWGEPDDVVRRPGICNGVVLFDTEQVVLVDPPYSNEEMLRCLDAHAGLKPKDINVVYITHAHSDHFDGIHYFPAARWCTGMEERDILGKMLDARKLDGNKLEGLREKLTPNIQVVPLPGHTMGSTGLLFDGPEGKVLVAGDSVMTREFLNIRRAISKAKVKLPQQKRSNGFSNIPILLFPDTTTTFCQRIQIQLKEISNENYHMPKQRSSCYCRDAGLSRRKWSCGYFCSCCQRSLRGKNHAC